MSRRRDDLKALFAGAERAPPLTADSLQAPESKALVPAALRPRTGIANPSSSVLSATADPLPVQRSGSGALKAMGLELDSLKLAAAEAHALRGQLSAGELVATLDPGLIDRAFVRDRMATSPAADAELELSLAEHGQQVPVLVRPHPRKPGHYEAVYGHRRIAAMTRLGKPVKALIRNISDDELVIAQGQENNARLDLSFIERARFAATLEARRFSRNTIIAALGVHKSDITRYVSVVAGLDSALIEAIGAAPKTGRARWQTLSEKLQGKSLPDAVQELVVSHSFMGMESDARFKAVMSALSPATEAPAPSRPLKQSKPVWQSTNGELQLEGGSVPSRFSFSGVAASEFSAFLQSRLDALHAEFKAQSGSGSSR